MGCTPNYSKIVFRSNLNFIRMSTIKIRFHLPYFFCIKYLGSIIKKSFYNYRPQLFSYGPSQAEAIVRAFLIVIK